MVLCEVGVEVECWDSKIPSPTRQPNEAEHLFYTINFPKYK